MASSFTFVSPKFKLTLRPLSLSLHCKKSALYSAAGGPGQTQKARGPLVAEIPLEKIRRPLAKTRANDPQKVKELMESIAQIGLQEPIDVIEVDGVYYGCHRYEAHQRLGLPTIRCKIRKGTKETLRHHLR